MYFFYDNFVNNILTISSSEHCISFNELFLSLINLYITVFELDKTAVSTNTHFLLLGLDIYPPQPIFLLFDLMFFKSNSNFNDVLTLILFFSFVANKIISTPIK